MLKTPYLYILILICFFGTAYSQWTQLPGPWGGHGGGNFGFYQDEGLVYMTGTAGVFASTDRGYHWNLTKWNLPDSIVDKLVLFTKNKLILLECQKESYRNRWSLYVSTDSGNSFSELFDSALNYSVATVKDSIFISRNITYDITDRRSLVASLDGGRTWKDLTPKNAVFDNLRSDGRCLYAQVGITEMFYNWKILRSVDRGRNWDTIKFNHQNKIGDYENVLALEVSIFGEDTLLWASITPDADKDTASSLYQVRSSGDSLVSIPFPGFDSVYSVYYAIQSLQFNGSSLLASNGYQLWKYSNETDKWNDITTNIYDFSLKSWGIGRFMSVKGALGERTLVCPTPYGGVCGTTIGDSIFYVSDSGIFCSRIYNILPGEGSLVVNAQTKYNTIYESTDKGETWLNIVVPKATSPQIDAIDTCGLGLIIGYDFNYSIRKKNGEWIQKEMKDIQMIKFIHLGNLLFCLTNAEVLRSDDSGMSWKKLAKIPASTYSFSAISYQNKIYESGGKILYSDDSCITWKTITAFPYVISNCWNLATDGQNIYATVSYRKNGIFQTAIFSSSDEGANWKLISNPSFDGPIPCMKILPINERLIYISKTGVYRCDLDGNNLVQIPLPKAIKEVLDINSDSNFVYVSTYGFGIFRASLSDILNSTSSVKNPFLSDDRSVHLTPNPSKDFILVGAPSSIEVIKIYDVKGNEMIIPQVEYKIAENIVKVDIKKLLSGTYFCKVVSNEKASTVKFIKE